MSEELCEKTDMPKYSCAHCQGIKEEPVAVYGNDDTVEFERIGHSFEAQYGGVCTIDMNHIVKRKTRVSKVQRADNPMLPISGVACASCTKILPHA